MNTSGTTLIQLMLVGGLLACMTIGLLQMAWHVPAVGLKRRSITTQRRRYVCLGLTGAISVLYLTTFGVVVGPGNVFDDLSYMLSHHWLAGIPLVLFASWHMLVTIVGLWRVWRRIQTHPARYTRLAAGEYVLRDVDLAYPAADVEGRVPLGFH